MADDLVFPHSNTFWTKAVASSLLNVRPTKDMHFERFQQHGRIGASLRNLCRAGDPRVIVQAAN